MQASPRRSVEGKHLAPEEEEVLMRTAVLMAISLSMIGAAGAGEMANARRKPIQIPAQQLGLALQRLEAVERLHVVFLSDDVANRDTFGASGNLTCAEALEQLLRGTDLTYGFLEANTVIILPVTPERGMPTNPSSMSGPGNGTGKGRAAVDGEARADLVTITSERPTDAQLLEYFRGLAATSRVEYKRLAKTLPFVDSGTVRFPDAMTSERGPDRHVPLGWYWQSGAVAGIAVARVFLLTPKKAEQAMLVQNGNSFPMFVEIDYGKTAPGDGAYAALAAGETLLIGSWPPTLCVGRENSMRSLALGCHRYSILSGIARVRTLTEWKPADATPPTRGDSNEETNRSY
jgi:hypothetical protein